MMNKIWTILLLALVSAIGGHQPVCFAQVKAVKVDSRTKKQLVDLFTVMSRNADFFKQGKMTNTALVQFGILSNWDAHPQLFRQVGEGNTYRLPAKHVQAIAGRYFGRTVRHISVGSWMYRDGYYIGSPGDAGEGERIVVTSLINVGNGLYRAYASFYGGENDRLLAKQKMTLKKVTSRGKSRYIVVDYLKA